MRLVELQVRYAELSEKVHHLAGGLPEIGVRPGHVVSIQKPSH